MEKIKYKDYLGNIYSLELEAIEAQTGEEMVIFCRENTKNYKVATKDFFNERIDIDGRRGIKRYTKIRR